MKTSIYIVILILSITTTSNAYSYWWVLRALTVNTGRSTAINTATRVGVSTTLKKSVNKIRNNPSKSTLGASVGIDIERTLARKRMRTSDTSTIDVTLKAEFGIDLFSYVSNSNNESSRYLIKKKKLKIRYIQGI